MKINIKHCNNIDSGNISIIESKLNIKFGINGIGKSTIAKAIEYSIDESKNLSDLTPFKLLENNKEKLSPDVLGVDSVESLMVFNEDYVKQFIFKQDELVQNSFDIFIKTPSYQENIKKIEYMILDAKKNFEDDKDLIVMIDELKELSSYFKITKSGISEASKGYKSLVGGNKIENIPLGLESYAAFLQSEQCVSWIDWHNKGSDFLMISDNCPYCASSITKNVERIKKISEEYDKNNIKNLELLIKIIERLGEYFSPDTLTTLKKITVQKKGLDQDEINFLVSVKEQIDSLVVEKLEKIRFLSSSSFRDFEKVQEVLEPLKIEIALYDRLKSEKTGKIIHKLNTSLSNILKETGLLQGEVNKQKIEINDLVEKNQNEINQFLKNAGYRYKVVIEKDEYKLKLQHFDSNSLLSSGDQHLSFGEKNAFALILFMYESLSKNPNLIILDDPISSFDKNKKYAIMDALFKKENNFRGKTVLMLTHDIEPIINTIKVFKGEYLAEAHFLEFKNGVLSEKEIKSEHILTFSQICDEIITSNEVDDLIKLIYLRRNYEIINNKGNEYQVISNLFHKREKTKAEDYSVGKGSLMAGKDFENGVNEIKNIIKNFDYEKMLERIKDVKNIKKMYNLSKNSYEKIQLFGILNEDYASKTMKKFIKESYHTENEFISQLSPLDFDLVPEFIIKECDEAIKAVND